MKTFNNFGRSSVFSSKLFGTPKSTGDIPSSITIPKTNSGVAEKTGKIIKNNIQNVLSKKYGELDTRHIFDGIPDMDVENNISIAESTIKNNIDRGLLVKDYNKKLPNLRDGLALSYAAANSGNNNAATKAKEAAYTENENETTEMRKFSLRQKMNSGEASGLIDSIDEGIDKSNSSVNADKERTGASKGIRFKAEVDKIEKAKAVEADKNQGFVTESDSQSLSEKLKQIFDENKQKNKMAPYSPGNVSSTLGKYTKEDVYRDMFLRSFDFENAFKNDGDFLSSAIDFLRNIPVIGDGYEFAKDVSRMVWKSGCDLYLRPKGYNISADMLEHSLQEKPKDVVFYDDSEVAKKIKEDNKFITHLDKVVKKIENKILLDDEDESYNFNDGDLFYSIHSCRMSIDNIEYNNDGTKNIYVHLNDTYDYTEILTSMNKKDLDLFNISFGSLANDAATISSKFDAINSYDVDIYFTIRR